MPPKKKELIKQSSSSASYTSSSQDESRASTPKRQGGGGGGAEVAHGNAFHLAIALLLLFTLKDISKEDLGFQYEIALEKSGYDKFDDIVIKYKKNNGHWIEICIQCKHAASEGAKITADDFLSTKKKAFSILEYINSYYSIINNKNNESDIERYYVILSNRIYSNEKDDDFSFFQYKDNNSISTVSEILYGKYLTITFTDELFDYISQNSKLSYIKQDIENFCNQFIYVTDIRDLDKIIEQKVLDFCGGNKANSVNVQCRLEQLVRNMYQKKISPSQKEINEKFVGKRCQFPIGLHCKFTGRQQELKLLEDALQIREPGYMFDVLITGMAGMGKSQLMCKYVHSHDDKYMNIILINAENQRSLEASFISLAKEFELITNDKQKNIKHIVKSVYEQFSSGCLFIFDNADKILLEKDQESYIYLPNYVYKDSFFVVISQDNKWTSKTEIKVKEFTEETSVTFLRNSIQIACTNNELKELGAKLHHWPLALSITASYINEEKEDPLLNKSYSVSDFIQTYNDKESKLLDYAPQKEEMDPYNKSLSTMWFLIKDKLSLNLTGETSIQMLEILSLTDADNLPTQIFKNLDEDIEKLKIALLALKNNSLITIGQNGTSIHRMLQSVVRLSLNVSKKTETIKISQNMFLKYFENLDPFERKLKLGNVHILTLWDYILENNELVLTHWKHSLQALSKLLESTDYTLGIDFTKQIIQQIINNELDSDLCYWKIKHCYAQLLDRIGKYDEAETEIKFILNKIKATNDDDLYISLQSTLGSIYRNKGQYQDALDTYEQIIKLITNIYGETSLNTLRVLQAKARVLDNLARTKDALEVHEQVIQGLKDKLGEIHPETLTSMNDKSSALRVIGKFEESIKILDKVIEIRIQKLGGKHPDVLTSMNNKATVMYNFGLYADALEIFQDVLYKRTEQLGERHPITITVKNNKAMMLRLLGRYQEALKIHNQVFETLLETLGENHPNTIIAKNNTASVLYNLGRYKEALKLHDEVYESQVKNYGEKYLDSLTTLYKKGLVLKALGEYEESIKLLDYVLTEHNIKFGKNQHPNALTTLIAKATVLQGMGQFQEALEIYNEVLPLQIKKLKPNHPNILSSMYKKATALKAIGEIDEALKLLEETITAQVDKVGEYHPDTLMTKKEKANILQNQGEIINALKIYNVIYEKMCDTMGDKHPETQNMLVCINQCEQLLGL